MSAQQDFVRAVVSEMERQGLTKRDLAKALGCSVENVFQLLGKRYGTAMRISTAERLAAAVGCRLMLDLIPRAQDDSEERLEKILQESRKLREEFRIRRLREEMSPSSWDDPASE